MKKPYLPITLDNRKQLALLSDEERGKLLIELLEFAEALYNEQEYTPENLEPISQIVFDHMTAGIVSIIETATKRMKSGAKGGSKREANCKQTASKREAKCSFAYENVENAKQTVSKREAKSHKEKEERTKEEKENKQYIYNNPFQNTDILTEFEEREINKEKEVVLLPLNDGSDFSVYEDDVREYENLYPAVDILQELRNMRGWLLANPTKRKTKSGIRRFINSWLAKEQDKGGTKPTREKSFIEVAAEIAAEEGEWL